MVHTSWPSRLNPHHPPTAASTGALRAKRGAHASLDGPSDIFSRSNAGVKNRAERDKTAREAANKKKNSVAALQRKAALTHPISSG